MAKKPPSPTSAWARKLLDEQLDAFVRALAIEAAREDHAKELRRRQREKGGRPRKLSRKPNQSEGGTMNATDLLLAAYGMAMANHQELHQKWISISFKLGPIAGTVHTISLQRIGRLDMMLRLLEGERLEMMRVEPSNEPEWSLDLQFALSENWLLSAYEVARAAKKPFKASGKDASRLLKLEHRLAVVRMPIAKGVIQGMDKKLQKDSPPVLVKAGDDTLELYQDDGSYIMPQGLCAETGAALWYPVDMTAGQTVAICRRDLSDEMLSLFD